MADQTVTGNLTVTGTIFGQQMQGLRSALQKQANYTMAQGEASRILLHNTAATGNITMTLPTPVSGADATFLNNATGKTLTVKADAGSRLAAAGIGTTAVGGTLSTSQFLGAIRLEYMGVQADGYGLWVVTSIVGTWGTP